MKSLIEELYYRNLEARHSPTAEMKEYFAEMDENESNLLPILNDKQKELFTIYSETLSNANGCQKSAAFIDGFRMGATMMIEVLFHRDDLV